MLFDLRPLYANVASSSLLYCSICNPAYPSTFSTAPKSLFSGSSESPNTTNREDLYVCESASVICRFSVVSLGSILEYLWSNVSSLDKKTRPRSIVLSIVLLSSFAIAEKERVKIIAKNNMVDIALFIKYLPTFYLGLKDMAFNMFVQSRFITPEILYTHTEISAASP